MGDRTQSDLSYGHFGTATYSPDEQEWFFSRASNRTYALTPLGEPRLVSQASPTESVPSSSNAKFPSQRHGRQIKELVKFYPEVQPATTLLSRLLCLSEAVEDATARHSPTQSDLLAFGSIFSESTHRNVAVAAFACGATGSDVRIVQIQTQRKGWNDTKAAWLECPTIRGEAATWRGKGAPVLQVCFARSVEEGAETWLAVRLITRTLIFRPVLRKTPSLGSQSSNLEFNRTLELDIATTGGLPHADICSNPWFTRQFAVIDQHGNWSVWEHESWRRRQAKLVRICGLENGDREVGVKEDGWARISWVCNPSTIAVSTRRTLSLFDITNDAVHVQDINLGLPDDAGWILDFVVLLGRAEYMCVLSTTHLIILRTQLDHEGVVSAKTAMSMRHFRSAEDISMRLSTIADQEEFQLFIHSSLHAVVVKYSLTLDDSGAIAITDDVELSVPPDVTEVHVRSVEFGHKPATEASRSLLARFRELDVRYYAVTTLGKDLSLRETLYFARRPEHKVALRIRAPEWEQSTAAKSAYRAPSESFVVEEDDILDESGEAGNVLKAPVSRYVSHRRAHQQRLSRTGLEWTVDYTHSVRQLQTPGSDEDQNVAHAILQQAHDVLEHATTGEGTTSIQTLREMHYGEITVSNLEQATAQLHDLVLLEVSAKAQHNYELRNLPDLVMRRVHVPFIPGQDDGTGGLSLSAIYETIMDDWIYPLTDKVPTRVKAAKEHLARRLAAEVALASHMLRREGTLRESDIQSAQRQDSSQGQELRTRESTPELPGSSSQLSALASQSQATTLLPTPSPTATASITTASSHLPSFAASEISRLSRYTSFTKPAPPALPRALTNVLSHWAVGTDPASYDWLSTSRNIASQQEYEEQDSQLTEKQRARLQRKAERHIRRQRREAEASQASQVASIQMPSLLVSASQPAEAQSQSQPGTIVGNSQSFSSGQTDASQAVPRRYGGRPPSQKRRRKQGF